MQKRTKWHYWCCFPCTSPCLSGAPNTGLPNVFNYVLMFRGDQPSVDAAKSHVNAHRSTLSMTGRRLLTLCPTSA